MTAAASTEKSADRRMLVLVRDAKGLSQRELATLADVNQSTISKAENGLAELKGDTLRHVAHALDCPVELLTHPTPQLGLDVSCLHNRRRSSRLTAVAKNKIQALAHLSRLSIEQIMDGQPVTPVTLPRVAQLDAPDPVEIAAIVREHLRLPAGPVKDLVGALENAGVVVFERPLGSTAQDAVSSWPQTPGRVPMLVVNGGLSGDRQRFTIAHELGHLVMHRLPGDDQEAQADLFAASLLAPPEEIRPDLAGLTTAQFRRLVELKPKWGMSIAALIRRAYDIDEISDRQYREFQLRLNRLGWKTSEPIEVPPEHPTTLHNLLQSRLRSGQAVTDLARTALMTEQSFRRYFPIEPRDSAMTA
ncbi:hypothetical protein DDP54_07835 [Cellulomonas sp. WB94]|jgi:Zn-dependent peptidase ImmA (M78 family)/DNA-binding XRE family transcriptional regulator|uniref:helix-turn-helix domain-containing protein n=1 Tax=Cellulomonas sp. WB94 TaxID=2173174 RepID=UPI000D567B03|nr:XRE family transcriptional regulator [Cellulomonas sp. WB94]PVU82930.1 hypothetical protein DDP54_07835 [Cellulomonas sp. WB94]